MYGMFVLVGAGGLMATAQLAPIAKDFKIDAVPVSLIGTPCRPSLSPCGWILISLPLSCTGAFDIW
jgi:hypothetical protein